MYIASWLGEFFKIRKIPPMNIANLTISLGKKVAIRKSHPTAVKW